MNECYVEIDKKVIQTNVENIITKYNNYKYYIGVVKGNAYGHGYGIINSMEKGGINYFAVSTLKEAIEVRKLTNLPILCLQPIELEELTIAQQNTITITISSYEYYKKLLNFDLKLKCHLKIDTGMNRLGLTDKEQIKEVYNNLINNKNIKLEGIFTHLATVGIIDKKWDIQISNFIELTKDIDLKKIDIVHIYSSNSLVIHPKLDIVNGVRIGILLYGIVPKKINYNGLKGKLRKLKNNYIRKNGHLSSILDDYDIDVKPSFNMYSKVIEIKKVKANQFIGYGLKFKSNTDLKIAIVPVGYADGLSLKNSGRYVSINSVNYKIVGSINMRMICIVIDDSVKINDKVTIIGNNIQYISNYTGVSPHNLLTCIPSDINRIYR